MNTEERNRKKEEYKIYYDSHQDEIKVCRSCKKEKRLAEFSGSWPTSNDCKACKSIAVRTAAVIRSEKYREHYKENKNELRKCQKCGESKPLIEFSPSSLKNTCESCRNTTRVARKATAEHQKIERELKENWGKHYGLHPDEIHSCNKCNMRKPLREFNSTYAYRNICRQCRSEERQVLSTVNILEYRDYYTSHQNELRTCNKCEQEKTLSEFSSSYQARNTCKKCMADATKDHREKSPLSVKETIAKMRNIASSHIVQKKSVPCPICGKSYPPYVMDFHHLGEKVSNISRMAGSSPNRIDREADKCDIVCANCHRNLTFEESLNKEKPVSKTPDRPEVMDIPTLPGDPVRDCRRCGCRKNEENFTKLKTGKLHSYCKKCLREINKRYSLDRDSVRTGKQYIIDYKDNRRCIDCGERFRYWMLDFDHVSGEKVANVNSLQNGSIDAIANEVAKCELVCVNCHRERTHARRNSSGEGSSQIVQVSFENLRAMALSKLDTAKSILEKHHYAGFGRSSSCVYAVMHSDETVAVVKFSPVIRKEVANKEGMAHFDVLELDRFCIVPKFQTQNLPSKVMSLVINLVKKQFPHVKMLVSFADPAQGHTGGLYRASNWTFVGTGAESYVYVHPDGGEMNKKTLYEAAKRRGLSEKEYAASLGMSRVKTPGKHKFIYRLR